MVKKFIAFLFFGTVMLGHAQQEPKIFTLADTLSIRIGEQIEYQISVDKKSEVVFPKLDNLGLLEVVTEGTIDTLKNELIKKYTITGFDSGSFYIPKQEVFVKDKKYYTDSLLVNVATVKVDTAKVYDIKNNAKEPYSLDDFEEFINWFLLIAIVIVLVISMYFLTKKKTERTIDRKPKIPAYQEAIQKFNALEAVAFENETEVKEYYVALTEIIRIYLGKEVKINTLEATTAELIQLIEVQNSKYNIGITRETIEQLSGFLRHADFVKFAKLRPSLLEIKSDKNLASTLVEKFKPSIDAFKEAQKELLLAQEVALKETMPKPVKKMSKKSKVLIVLTVIGLTVIGYLSYDLYKSAQIKKDFFKGVMDTASGAAQWQVQAFGKPAMYVNVPQALQLVNNNVPEAYQATVSNLEMYTLDSPALGIIVSVNSQTFVDQSQINTEAMLQQIIQNIESGKGVADLEFERQPASFGNNVFGTYLKGSYRQGTQKVNFNLVILALENNVWQFNSLHPDGNAAAAATVETMIQSIKIESE